MVAASLLQALENNTMSLAYITHIMADPPTLVFTPLILWCLNSFSNSLERISYPNIKIYKDKGSLCLNPLSGLKFSDLPPFINTSKKDTDVMHSMIQLINTSLKPNLINTNLMKLQLILS